MTSSYVGRSSKVCRARVSLQQSYASCMLPSKCQHFTGLYTASLMFTCMWTPKQDAYRSILASVKAFMC